MPVVGGDEPVGGWVDDEVGDVAPDADAVEDFGRGSVNGEDMTPGASGGWLVNTIDQRAPGIRGEVLDIELEEVEFHREVDGLACRRDRDAPGMGADR